jgi:hypothetical protein
MLAVLGTHCDLTETGATAECDAHQAALACGAPETGAEPFDTWVLDRCQARYWSSDQFRGFRYW